MLLCNLMNSLHLVAVSCHCADKYILYTLSFLVSLLVINCGVDAGGPVTVTVTPKRIYTDANQPQPNPMTSVQHPKPLFTPGQPQSVCSGQSAVGSQKSVRKHVQGMSEIKKDKGSNSKSRLVRFH